MTTIHKCQCGDPNCDQYTLGTQRSVGFDLETATKYAAADDLLSALTDLDKAASDVARLGVVTGPQWSRLTVASLRARAAITKARLPG